MIKKHLPLFYQLVRFGIVGVTAAAVHFSIVVLLVQTGVLKEPLIANIFAFMVAFHVSYSGHRYWTFRGTETSHRTALPKLLAVSSLGFCVNEGLFYLFFVQMGLPYPLALFIVLTVMPIITFTLSKLWVFA